MRPAQLVVAVFGSLLLVCAMTSEAPATVYGGAAPDGSIVVGASQYYRAKGEPYRGSSSLIQYAVVPETQHCGPDGVACDPRQYNGCLAYPRDARNVWISFNFYISIDGGTTWPDLPNGKECLNDVVLEPGKYLDPQLVADWVKKHVPDGRWEHQPGKDKSGKSLQALINFPFIVYADTPPDKAWPPFTLEGARITVKAHVQTYQWDFGDGADLIQSPTPGRKFDSSFASCDAKDCSSYLHHVYRQPGVQSIVMSLIWTATYQVQGEPQPRDVPGTITVPSPAQRVDFVQSHGVLVSGGGS